MSDTLAPAVAPPAPPADTRRGWRQRAVPAGFAGLLVLTGLLYTFLWVPVVDHASAWGQPLDLWDSFKVAHLIAWGDYGDTYTIGGFVTFPGIALLLAPVAWVTGQLGLHDSYPWYIPHASAWPVLAPIALAVGVLPLFASDALASHLGVGQRRRVLLCAAQTVVLWPVLAMWGHPEDAIAVGFALYAVLAALRGRWRRAGWLFGAAIAFQPLVLLVLPMVVAIAPGGQRLRLLVRGALPSVVLLLIPLAQSWRATTYALVKQPTYPLINHPTPLLPLAPVLANLGRVSSGVKGVSVRGHTQFTEVYARGGQVVAPGAGRLLALLLAVLLGVWVARRHPPNAVVVWLGALALAGWCALEAVMVSYYVWPVLALLLVVAALGSWWRFGAAVVVALFCTVWSQYHMSPWAYWAPLVLALAAGLVAAWPRGMGAGRADGRSVEQAAERAAQPASSEVSDP